MENSPAQDAEDNSYLCFQRTPSLRRKWRKRYGGLDGNKLLEPSRDDDNRENGLTTEPRQERNTRGQDTAPLGAVPRPLPRAPQQSPPPQRPVSLGGPGPAVLGNGALKPPLPQLDPDRSSSSTPQTWTQLNRTTETQPGLIKRRAAADMLFDSFASDGRLNINQFFEAVWSSGIQRSDSRIRDCFVHMRKLQDSAGTVDRSTFLRCVTGFVSLILKALQGRFVIPDFSTFSEETQKLFTKCKQLSTVQDKEQGGEDSRWAVSICTVDGQRLSLGDCSGSVVLGEASWPLLYGLSVDQLGPEYVHRYVGLEEYSKYTSPFTLTSTGVPHSPLIETGAIVTTSLLQMSERLCTEEEEKYESVLNMIRRLCNKENVNLNCSSYQGNRKDSVRLHALSFYLQEKQCFPEAADINATLDLLLQCASTEVTCDSGAAMAASLANGGLCPLSGDQVLSPGTTRSMLSMMQVAGMKDYSRMFHYKTSVPAVSSQHGVLLAIIPGVLGLFCSSPQLDAHKNPWRAVHFCQELVSLFQLHCFDIRTPFRQLLAYRQWKTESEGYQIMNILLAAFRGDLQSLRRYFLSGGEVNAVDYDGRSALHVAAAQGHTEVISFLLENTGANHALKDRWGNSPLQEARRHNKTAAAGLLLTYQEQQEAE